MLRMNVALPNGHVELLTLLPSSRVQDLSKKARRAVGKKNLRLITGKNRILVHPDKQNPGRSRDTGQRVPDSSGTSGTSGSNKQCLCRVGSWR